MENHKKKSCGCGGCSHPISQSVGEHVITITRNTFNIADALPYCIWGSIYANTSYGAVLQTYLPSGMTVTSANTSGGVVFTYTSGLSTDTVTVTVPTIGLISYLEILSNLKTNYMKSCFMLFNANAANDAPFLDNSSVYQLQSGGLFLQKVDAGNGGRKGVELIIPTSRRTNNNSIPNMIEIYLRNEDIKADTVWIHQFPYYTPQPEPQVPITFNMTVFISENVNLNAEKISLRELAAKATM